MPALFSEKEREMEYFLGHLGPIIAAGIILGLVAFATVIMASKNEAERDINDERCEYECGSCEFTEVCIKPGKRV